MMMTTRTTTNSEMGSDLILYERRLLPAFLFYGLFLLTFVSTSR